MKKFVAITLIVIAVLSLFACGQSNNTPASTTVLQNTTEAIEAETTTEKARQHSVPDNLDFGGKEFRIAYPMWQGYEFYFFADDITGDIMNDSIYERKSKVNEYLNVDITQNDCGTISEVVSEIKKIALAGDNVYSQCLLHCISGVSDLAAGGYLYNWDDLKYVDYTADWWNQEQMDVLRLGKNTYYGISDFMIPCPYVVYFSKEMVNNYGLDNPYQLVYDDKWTLDNFYKMAESVVKDVNGDGNMDIGDQYGVTANEVSKYISFMTGADQFITQKNSDGRIELALNTEKTVSLVENFLRLMTNNVIYYPASGETADQLTINSGRLLFQLASISHASAMRDYEIDFGFLPYPKYDEKQENYRSQDWGGLCCVISTIDDPEFVGAVSELLAFESGNTVVPTYYDVVLTGKLARDDDTVNMLDILFDTICYEVGGNYFGFSSGFSDLFYTVGRLPIVNKSADFASWYAKNEPVANSTIEKFYENLESVEG